MARLVRLLILLVILVSLIGLLALGALFLISGGQPIDYLQTALLRFQLAGRETEINQPYGTSDEPVRFSVAGGATPRQIAQSLQNSSLIRDPQLFVDYVRLNDLDRELEAGTYFLRQTQSLAEIAVALTDSRSSSIAFRILEGERLEEVVAKIDQAAAYFAFRGGDFLQAVGPGAIVDENFAALVGLPSGASLEGFLFPATYDLPPDVTPTGLRDILLRTFQERVGPQLPQDAAAQGLSLFQVVTLASIVEREAIHADEQPLIAGVYRNRLRINMRLEADPTVQYGIGWDGTSWWPRITRADYSGAISPYNTYLNPGLPPGPIASPGLAAIQAVVYPQASEFLFFRADCRSDGYHDFASTFEEHLANGC